MSNLDKIKSIIETQKNGTTSLPADTTHCVGSNSEEPEKSVVKYQMSAGREVTREDIKNYLCPNATEKELFIAVEVCRSLNLNPFSREVHFVKISSTDKMATIVGYEVYLKRADRTGKLAGWSAGVDEKRGVSWVKIHRKDWTEPFVWEVSLSEFDKKHATWKSMPTFMGKKVAIAQGFRLAFPDELGGMPYTEEEYKVFDLGVKPLTGTSPEEQQPERVDVFEEPAPQDIAEKKMVDSFVDIRKKVGDEKYFSIIGSNGYESVEQIRNKEEARKIYTELLACLPKKEKS